MRTVMLSLTALLTSPEPDDPQDAMVARQYKNQSNVYKDTAAYWTYVYAIENKTDEMVRRFVNFESKHCRDVSVIVFY